MQDKMPHADELMTTSTSRRAAVREFAGLAGKLALAGLPFFLSSVPHKASAQTTTNAIDTYNYYLLLALMYEELYTEALSSPDLQLSLSGNNRSTAEALQVQASVQVVTIQDRINGLAGTPITKPGFDWSAGSATGGPGLGQGPLKAPHSPFTDVAVFFATAQMLADLMVRAYKAQLYTLMNNKSEMTVAMQLQSTLARHAAHLRRTRRLNALAVPPGVELKPWITKNESGIVAPYAFIADKVYQTEDETDQDQVDVVVASGHTREIVTEAFDEHLPKKDVEFILDAFLA